MATSTVNSQRRSGLPVRLPWAVLGGLTLAACVLLPATQASADTAAELDVLRVDVPLDRVSFRSGELKISSLIADNTYIDVEEFNLRAIELEASSTRDGEVRLKVGRYVTPPVPLPGPNNEGLLRIEAPHKSNKSWRLLIKDRIHITSLTAVLEPRDDDVAYYESRYENRGYTLGRDNNYRPYSRHDNWPYSWLGNNYDYNRRSAHWFWLNDTRSRFHYNPGYGHSHRHTPRCYNRYGRHMRFNASPNSRRRISIGAQRSRDFDRHRNSRQRGVAAGPQQPSSQQRPVRNPNREAVTRAPATPRTNSDAQRNLNAQRNQAAQAQLQQRMQQTQQTQRREQAQARERGQQAARQQQLQRQQRRDASDARSSRSMGPRAPQTDRARRYNRRSIQRGSNGPRQKD